MPSQPSTTLETFPNPQADIDYTIRMSIPEFTCLCPKTGQPDFATLELEYVPDKRCVELKSLKLYVWSFRDRGAFHEAVTNEIVAALAAAVEPRFMRLSARFNVRGAAQPAKRSSPSHRQSSPPSAPPAYRADKSIAQSSKFRA